MTQELLSTQQSPVCRVCEVELHVEINWFPSLAAKGNRICKSCVRQQYKEWVRAHPDRMEVYRLARRGKYAYEKIARLEVIRLLGGKCSWPGCSCSDSRILQIDHVKGHGLLEIRKYGTHYYQHVLQSILHGQKNKYQLLCPNHNWLKRFENNEQPHQIIEAEQLPT
jgi:hypothetical protein